MDVAKACLILFSFEGLFLMVRSAQSRFILHPSSSQGLRDDINISPCAISCLMDDSCTAFSIKDESCTILNNYLQAAEASGVIFQKDSAPTGPPWGGKFSTTCYSTTMQITYAGTLSVAHTGAVCESWAKNQGRNGITYRDNQFPENSVEAAKNYCRKPGFPYYTPLCWAQGAGMTTCSIPRC